MAVDKLTGIKIKKDDGTYSAEIPISVQLENVIGAGTAAAKNVPASGNASTSQVVMGDDTRLTDARPASDVSAWAKASTKPSYTAAEVGAIASTLKGVASGVAELDSTGKVPSSQLPSYVDDVLEYDAKSSFPSTGETGKIYVDKTTNLTYRWSGTTYVEISPSLALGTTSSTAFRGDYGNIAYEHATNKGSAYASGMYKITTNSEGHVTAATAIQKSDITGLGIPGQDTTYSAATTTADGLMSSTDKTKLNGIATGAEVNQNAFSNIKVGSTTIEADSETDTLELAAGSNITLTPDASGDKITIAATDTTYSDATTSAHGLMSASDKTKLDGVATGAEVNQNAFSNVKVGSTTIEADSKTDTLELAAGSNITLTPDATGDKVTIAATDTTYSAATTSAAGLMSAADKTKLDGIATGAQVNTVTSVADKTGAVILTSSDVGLGNVDNTSDATKKSNFTGSVASGNTGFVTGGDVYDAIAGAGVAAVTSVNSKTGVVVLTKSDIGLGNVDNTTDANKSVAYASNAGTVNNHTVESDVPADAVFTDTIYSDATTSVAGLMSTTDKTKLNGIASGAEVNQNTFSNIKVGSSIVEADSKTDTLELVAGSSISLIPDTTNDKVTINAVVDSSLSNTSTNPVQNKVVYEVNAKFGPIISFSINESGGLRVTY